MTTAAPEAPQTLSDEELELIHKYWRAANYLSVGQIYLMGNALLKESLKLEHIKPRLLGHWGTTPGLNLIYVHLNRIIKAYDLDMIYIPGPPRGSTSCSSSSRSRAGSRATRRRRRRARSTKAGSSAMPSRTPTGRRSTIPT